MCTSSSFLGSKLPESEVDDSPLSSADIKYVCSYNLSPPYIFMAKVKAKLYLCLIRHHTVKMDVGVDVELHMFLTWALRITGFLDYVHRPVF
jgi:hypothetical protein